MCSPLYAGAWSPLLPITVYKKEEDEEKEGEEEEEEEEEECENSIGYKDKMYTCT